MNKPEGLPAISDVVLDKVHRFTLKTSLSEIRPKKRCLHHVVVEIVNKFPSCFLSFQANKTPLRQLDPSRLPGMNCGPDFTPSFANLGRPSMGGGNRGPVSSNSLCVTQHFPIE